MTLVVTATFDGATSGEATAASTGCTVVGGVAAARQHSTAQKINGASVYFAGTSTGWLSWTIPPTQRAFVRLYLWRDPAVATAGDTLAAHFRNTGDTQLCRLRIARTTGNLMVTDGSTTVAQYAMAASQWYRVDWSAEIGVGQRVRLYTGASLHSANTADAVAGGTLLALTGSTLDLRKFEAGVLLGYSPPQNFYLDELAVDDAALPAPWSPPAAGRRVERKVAGAWTPHIVEKKVAGAWVPQIIERKDAGVWS